MANPLYPSQIAGPASQDSRMFESWTAKYTDPVVFVRLCHFFVGEVSHMRSQQQFVEYYIYPYQKSRDFGEIGSFRATVCDFCIDSIALFF